MTNQTIAVTLEGEFDPTGSGEITVDCSVDLGRSVLRELASELQRRSTVEGLKAFPGDGAIGFDCWGVERSTARAHELLGWVLAEMWDLSEKHNVPVSCKILHVIEWPPKDL